MRGTPLRQNKYKWHAACTGRYKLVVSPVDPPWLIDTQKNPDELTNFCRDPKYRQIVQTLAKELLGYGEKYQDIRLKDVEETLRKLMVD